MIEEKHIKEIENLINKEKIIQFELLQISFDIACIKIIKIEIFFLRFQLTAPIKTKIIIE